MEEFKEYISIAEWTSNNGFHFLYTNDDLFPMVMTEIAMDRDGGSNVWYNIGNNLAHLFNNKYLIEAKLRGWKMEIEAIPYNSDPECDVADVDITLLHPNPEVTALESALIHKMLAHTSIKFRSATDNRSMIETIED